MTHNERQSLGVMSAALNIDCPELAQVETPPQAQVDHAYILLLEARLARCHMLMNLATVYLQMGNYRRAQQALSQGGAE